MRDFWKDGSEITDEKAIRYMLAVHEAGHAVVSTVLGLGIRYATLRPRSSEVEGLVRSRTPLDTDRWSLPHMASLMAGYEAERYALEQYGSSLKEQRDYVDRNARPEEGNDTDTVLRVAFENSGNVEDTQRKLDQAIATAHKLLHENWDSVLRVAKALIVHQTIKSREIKRLCRIT